jgi:hypothetical protein
MTRTSTGWALRRRDLLKQLGLGAAFLPLLGGRARAAFGDRRFLCVVHPSGYEQSQWRPPAGPLATLPASAAGLEPYRSEVIFLPDVGNPLHPGSVEGAYGTALYGLPARTTGTYPEPRGRTVDQVVASVQPVSSTLALGVQTDVAPVPAGLGARRCFWAGEGQPVNPESDPYQVYQRLFAGVPVPGIDPAVRRLLIERKSLLDYVGRSVERWRQRLGTEDRLLADAHHAALRSAELQLGAITQAPASCSPPSAAVVAPVDITARAMFPKLLDAQLALAVAAASCGLYQVVTLQVSNTTGANIDFGSFVPGIPARGTGWRSAYRNWSDVAHNPVLGGVNHRVIVDRWVIDKLAGLLGRLQALPAPSGQAGTLLDASVVLWGSHMYDGVGIQRQKMSWMLAGSCGGYFATGQCVPGAGKAVAGVFADICKAMGVPGAPFGPLYGGLARV